MELSQSTLPGTGRDYLVKLSLFLIMTFISFLDAPLSEHPHLRQPRAHDRRLRVAPVLQAVAERRSQCHHVLQGAAELHGGGGVTHNLRALAK